MADDDTTKSVADQNQAAAGSTLETAPAAEVPEGAAILPLNDDGEFLSHLKEEFEEWFEDAEADAEEILAWFESKIDPANKEEETE